MIAPKLNEPDLDEFPAHLRSDMEFVFVETVDRVLDEALEPLPGTDRRPTSLPRGRRRPRPRREPAAARSR